MLHKLVANWFADAISIFHIAFVVFLFWLVFLAPELYPNIFFGKWHGVGAAAIAIFIYSILFGAVTTLIRINQNLEAIRQHLEEKN